MINISNLTVSYGDATVLQNCSLHVKKGERVALMGPSGCGKTTLLGCIAGTVRPSGGSIEIASKRIAYVFQEPRLLPWLTAVQNINSVLSDNRSSLPTAYDWLRRAMLWSDADKYPAELSGGMQQRIAICRALAYGGDILLLDEPLKGLNPKLREEIAELIRREAKGKTILLVTHDEWEAQALCDRILRFDSGKFI